MAQQRRRSPEDKASEIKNRMCIFAGVRSIKYLFENSAFFKPNMRERFGASSIITCIVINRILNQILGYQRQIERRTQQIDKNTQEIKRQVIKGVGEDRALDNYVN